MDHVRNQARARARVRFWHWTLPAGRYAMRAGRYAIAMALCGTVAHAHHSIAGMYDVGRPVTLDGVVAQFHFVNPHPFVMVDVRGANGTAQTWKLELDNRGELAGVGMTATTLKPGDRLVVTGSPARADSHALYVRRLERPADGFLYEQIGSSPRVRGLPR